jgi:hypothetical protein
VQQPNLSHPFHLHGYAFNVIGIGRSPDQNVKKINLKHALDLDRQGLLHRQFNLPPAKDTIAVPNNGYVVLRFRANNPGFWLFHCHFLFHIVIGMNLVLQVGTHSDLPHQIHPYHDVEQEVTVEEPEAGIVRAESQHHVSVVGHRDRVLRRRQIELAMQQPLPVQVQGVLQVDLLDVLVGGPADTDHVERVPVQMERMAEIRLLHWKKPRLEPLTGRFMHLTFVDEHDFDDGVQGNVYFMGAHAVLLAALGSVVSVAELRRRQQTRGLPAELHVHP